MSRLQIAFSRGPRVEIAPEIRPEHFWTVPVFGNHLYSISYARTNVFPNRAFHGSLVEVDEKARRRARRPIALSYLVELQRCGYRVCGATVDLALVVGRREMGSEVH